MTDICKHGPDQWLDASAQRAHVKESPVEPNLDELIRMEAEAAEEAAQAFIRHTMARVRLANALREMRENQPNLFSGMWDFNEVALPNIT